MQKCCTVVKSLAFGVTLVIRRYHAERKDMDVQQVLPGLFEGHAPITLQNAFHDALEALEEWRESDDEPSVQIHGVPVQISSVFLRMSDCTDLLPLRTQGVLGAIVGMGVVRAADRILYAEAARLVIPLCASATRLCRRPSEHV